MYLRIQYRFLKFTLVMNIVLKLVLHKPIYLLGFFSKHECFITYLIVPLYHFIALGCHLPFCIMRFHVIMKSKKQFI